MSIASEGSKVKVHYTGKLEDGTIFDTSLESDPLEFTIGEGRVIKGFEDAVIGMNTGDKKDITIDPENGYGPYREELKYEVEKDKIPENIQIEVGKRIVARNESNNTSIDLLIKEVTENSVTLDANHPLAGKILLFEIELVEVGKILN